ncbi:hypothetical protein ACWEPZ_02980 [Streptomyces sp. NPDC004288]
MTFEYRNPTNTDRLAAVALDNDVWIKTSPKGCLVPPDRVEEVIAGIRAAARQTTGQDDTGPAHPTLGITSEQALTGAAALGAALTEQDHTRVVAYRIPDRPGVLLCREHGEGWSGLTPVTSEDLPDGGLCTWWLTTESHCGRDVLVPANDEAES